MAGIVASGAGSVIYARHEQGSFEPEIGIQKGYEKTVLLCHSQPDATHMMSPLIHIWGMVVGGGDCSFLLF